MMSGIHPVKHEWCKFSQEVGWRFPDVRLVPVCHRDESENVSHKRCPDTIYGCLHSLPVWAETASIDFCFEIDVVQDCALFEMHEQSSSV